MATWSWRVLWLFFILLFVRCSSCLSVLPRVLLPSLLHYLSIAMAPVLVELCGMLSMLLDWCLAARDIPCCDDFVALDAELIRVFSFCVSFGYWTVTEYLWCDRNIKYLYKLHVAKRPPWRHDCGVHCSCFHPSVLEVLIRLIRLSHVLLPSSCIV